MSASTSPKLLQPQPLYIQLADLIRGQIIDGSYAPGTMLPSENELVQTYQVSRVTVRQALALLHQEGMVKRAQGKGTFVADQTIEQNFFSLHDFSRELQSKGHVPSFEILGHEWKSATAELKELFQLTSDGAVLVIERIKYSDQSPIMLEKVFIPKVRIPGFPLRAIKSKLLSTILDETYSVHLVRVRKSIQPIKIGRIEAGHLKVSPGSLGLLLDRVTWTNEKALPPIMFTRAIVPGERSRFYVDVGAELNPKDY